MQCINHHGLLAGFRSVPDPRRLQGRRYSVGAILTVAVAAILAKHTSVLAIAEPGLFIKRECGLDNAEVERLIKHRVAW
ncbi:MAG TPA: transposase family protein [Nitrolancea sp.]|nr:transposase family protein [Nitrolancea sp.]